MPKDPTFMKPSSTGPPRSKTLLYLAVALAIAGAVMALVPTILMFAGLIQFSSAKEMFMLPATYIVLLGIVILTAGLILQRRITAPMKFAETEKLRSRLE